MIRPAGQSRLSEEFWRFFRPEYFKRALYAIGLLATLTTAAGQPTLDTSSPLGFFTNVYSHLLKTQFNMGATWIQVYPTNQYTPAVHRLFQLAANVYEATSTNIYPTAFRPLFSRDMDGLGSNLFISGFTNVDTVTGPTDSRLALPLEATILAETNVPVINLPVNVYGVPWIIGARKGFPNFNEFAMESVFQLARKLQVTRPSTNSPIMDYQYNQMFLLSLTNQLGVECWNSYTNNFTDPVTIFVTDCQTVTLTNDEGLSTSISIPLISGSLQISNSTTGNWPGYNPEGNAKAVLLTPASFQIPLDTNISVVPLSVYRFNTGGSPYLTTNFDLPFETNVNINGNLIPQPHWYLTTSNDVRVVILDTSTTNTSHVIDYVQLNGPNSRRDLTSEIISQYDTQPGPNGSDLWDTNIQTGTLSAPVGIISQIGVSLGLYAPGAASGAWSSTSPIERENEIDAFRAFWGLGPIYNNPGEQQVIAQAEVATAIQAPFVAIACVVQHLSWQANDPLVHYLANDLNWSGAARLDRSPDDLTNEDLGRLNQRYTPWGGNPLMPGFDSTPFNLTLKDPLVWNSGGWDFPTNEQLSGAWLGRVHRGTPWQTIYLKSSDVLQAVQIVGGLTNHIGTNIWTAWIGDTNICDAVAAAPVQDWHLASLLAYLMNSNSLSSLCSVNAPAPNGWPGLLNGLTALTNTVSDSQFTAGGTPQFAPVVIASNSPQVQFIMSAIQSTQSSQPDHFFTDVGDILSIPQLTEQSPFLNWNDSVQQQKGISDEAYEILPGQLLPLLRADSIGSVSSANGQVVVRFTGYDNHLYAVQASTNLSTWVVISVNVSLGGGFGFTNAAPLSAGPQFYRSLLAQ